MNTTVTHSIMDYLGMYNEAVEGHSLPLKQRGKFKDRATAIAAVEKLCEEYALEITYQTETDSYYLAAMHPEKDETEDAEVAANEARDVIDDNTLVADPIVASLTEMQFALMNRIAHDEYNTTNGATPTSASDVNCWLWADEFAKDIGLTGKQVGGLLTTLETAGLIRMDKVAKKRGQADESSVWFTEAGFAAWQAVHQTPTDAAAAPAPKAKKAKKAKATEAVAAKKRGPAPEYKDEQVITVLVANPKREGSMAHGRFALYTSGMTVAAALAAGVRRDDFRWDTYHGYITIE